jgi:hypothetical protein
MAGWAIDVMPPKNWTLLLVTSYYDLKLESSIYKNMLGLWCKAKIMRGKVAESIDSWLSESRDTFKIHHDFLWLQIGFMLWLKVRK